MRMRNDSEEPVEMKRPIRVMNAMHEMTGRNEVKGRITVTWLTGMSTDQGTTQERDVNEYALEEDASEERRQTDPNARAVFRSTVADTPCRKDDREVETVDGPIRIQIAGALFSCASPEPENSTEIRTIDLSVISQVCGTLGAGIAVWI